ncbi:hypothetical protein, conserved [Eimeria necatrix]|uniref:Uncharacterized protein n=1 Tax=Eimeria necatrix TaxID=51315 RepID=U6MMH4_9EIME|nr:hypothetical protein, conserved [Eimeria necatrix]CDJ65216.1 hypothetical protein, conserved [Eimeria necatrix]
MPRPKLFTVHDYPCTGRRLLKPREAAASPAAGSCPYDSSRRTPDATQQQGILGYGEAVPSFAVSLVNCPLPLYDQDLLHHVHGQQLQLQPHPLQQIEGFYSPLPPSPREMHQLQIPSQQAASQRSCLRQEEGEVASKGALDSFSPTFATELLADIELDEETGSPAAAADAAAAAAGDARANSGAAGANFLLLIDVPVQQSNAAPS